MRVENLKKQESVVESVLFTMGQSVEIRQLAAALESDEETAIQAVERLKEKYDKRKAGMQIVRLDDSTKYGSGSCHHGSCPNQIARFTAPTRKLSHQYETIALTRNFRTARNLRNIQQC